MTYQQLVGMSAGPPVSQFGELGPTLLLSLVTPDIILGFVMCGCAYVWVLWCVAVLVICVLVCTVFLYCFVYVYLFLFVISGRFTVTE